MQNQKKSVKIFSQISRKSYSQISKNLGNGKKSELLWAAPCFRFQKYWIPRYFVQFEKETRILRKWALASTMALCHSSLIFWYLYFCFLAIFHFFFSFCCTRIEFVALGKTNPLNSWKFSFVMFFKVVIWLLPTLIFAQRRDT